jgi:hypothetical protein
VQDFLAAEESAEIAQSSTLTEDSKAVKTDTGLIGLPLISKKKQALPISPVAVS